MLEGMGQKNRSKHEMPSVLAPRCVSVCARGVFGVTDLGAAGPPNEKGISRATRTRMFRCSFTQLDQVGQKNLQDPASFCEVQSSPLGDSLRPCIPVLRRDRKGRFLTLFCGWVS